MRKPRATTASLACEAALFIAQSAFIFAIVVFASPRLPF
jgi:hypothetical protein